MAHAGFSSVTAGPGRSLPLVTCEAACERRVDAAGELLRSSAWQSQTRTFGHFQSGPGSAAGKRLSTDNLRTAAWTEHKPSDARGRGDHALHYPTPPSDLPPRRKPAHDGHEPVDFIARVVKSQRRPHRCLHAQAPEHRLGAMMA